MEYTVLLNNINVEIYFFHLLLSSLRVDYCLFSANESSNISRCSAFFPTFWSSASIYLCNKITYFSTCDWSSAIFFVLLPILSVFLCSRRSSLLILPSNVFPRMLLIIFSFGTICCVLMVSDIVSAVIMGFSVDFDMYLCVTFHFKVFALSYNVSWAAWDSGWFHD